jgi:hypothetical protein
MSMNPQKKPAHRAAGNWKLAVAVVLTPRAGIRVKPARGSGPVKP